MKNYEQFFFGFTYDKMLRILAFRKTKGFALCCANNIRKPKFALNPALHNKIGTAGNSTQQSGSIRKAFKTYPYRRFKMGLEENLQRLQDAKDLPAKHAVALIILDEILKNICARTPERTETNSGTRVSYGNLWYYEDLAIKVGIPAGNAGEQLAKSIDDAADAIEMVLLIGAPKDKAITVYEGETPQFSLIFGIGEPKFFVPGIVDGLQGKYFGVEEFSRSAKSLLGL